MCTVKLCTVALLGALGVIPVALSAQKPGGIGGFIGAMMWWRHEAQRRPSGRQQFGGRSADACARAGDYDDLRVHMNRPWRPETNDLSNVIQCDVAPTQ